MHILFATPEIAPFSKTGGLADVCAVLPRALQSSSATSSVSVVTPLYGNIDPEEHSFARRLTSLQVKHQGGNTEVVIYEGYTVDRVRVFFLAHDLFQEKGVYGPPEGGAFPNNAERFSFFSRAVVELCRALPIPVDIIHCHDWTTSLIPVYLDLYGGDELADTLTVLTLHNLAYQGRFSKAHFPSMEIPDALFTPDILEFWGDVNMAKGGILFADFISTVSDTYAEEILTEEGGYGLHGVLQTRSEELFGIPHGINNDTWNPETDSFLPVTYDIEHLNGKRRNKSELQHIFGLPLRPMVPLFGFLSELNNDRGTGITIDALTELLEAGETLQAIFLADGDDEYKARLCKLQEKFPKSIGLHFGHDEALEHRTLAGIDVLLHPSHREPGGHLHLRAMRYGTVPLARSTGALRDAIADWHGEGDAPDGQGAGILFDAFQSDALRDAMKHTVGLFLQPRHWRPMVEACMRANFSWDYTAKNYLDLYRDLIAED